MDKDWGLVVKMVVKIWKSLVLLDSWFDPCHPHQKVIRDDRFTFFVCVNAHSVLVWRNVDKPLIFPI